MTRFALATSLILLATPLAAQDTQALAEEYANLPTVQTMMDNVFSPESMAQSVLGQLPPSVQLTDDQVRRIGQAMSEVVAPMRPRMQALMIEHTASLFTAGEISALIDFYQSEHGAGIMQKMPAMMQATMAAIAPEMQAAQRAAVPRIQAILSE